MESSANSSESETESLTGYELVADLMRRQDEVIMGIDALNERIEAAIREVTIARELENASNASHLDGEAAGTGFALQENNAA